MNEELRSDTDDPGSAKQTHWTNPTADEIETLLENAKRIAIVGLSADPSRASNGVGAYLLSQGYEIIPVNPKETEPLGLKAYPDLASVPGRVDIVDVFRRPEFAPDIVRQALEIGVGAIWLQEGVVSPEAYALATEAGMTIVMDKCMLKEHSRLKRS